jgi:DNA repair exonuclease SbcCD ATPase subunit
MAGQYSAAAKERANLESAIVKVNKLTNELHELKKALQAQYPEFTNAGPELAEGLEKLIYLNQEIEKASEAAKNWQDSQQQRQERQAELVSSIAKYRSWDLLGADPAEKTRGTRRTAAACLKSWAAFQDNRQKLTAINRQLTDHYGLFCAATTSELATINNISQARAALAADIAKAEQAYKNAAQKIGEYEDAQREHLSKFGDLRELQLRPPKQPRPNGSCSKNSGSWTNSYGNLERPPKYRLGCAWPAGPSWLQLPFSCWAWTTRSRWSWAWSWPS